MILSDNLVGGVLNYLMTKPYNEVAGLVQGIRSEAQKNQLLKPVDPKTSTDSQKKPVDPPTVTPKAKGKKDAAV